MLRAHLVVGALRTTLEHRPQNESLQRRGSGLLNHVRPDFPVALPGPDHGGLAHHAPPGLQPPAPVFVALFPARSEEHTSELQSLMRISYSVFCLKKQNNYSTISSQYI